VKQIALTCQKHGDGLCCNAKRTILPKASHLINLSGWITPEKRYNDASFAD
jgi:hypothetical protein